MPLSTQVGQQTYKYDKNPDVCPICHHAIAPGIIGKSISRVITEDAAKIDIAFQCTSSLCLRMFIGCYLGPNGSQDQLAFENKRVARTLTRQDAENKRIYKLIDVVPKTYKTPAIDQEIVNISKGFKEIYEQAAAAELYGLNEIAGVGYRS